MTWRSLGAIALLAVACDDAPDLPEPEPPDCQAEGEPVLELGRDLGREGPLTGPAALDYGHPPQGGAPYLPLELRARGPLVPGLRVPVLAEATGPDGEILGDADVGTVFLCSNTGPHAGWWFGGEIHVRFWGRALEDLEGLPVDVRFTVEPPDDPPFSAEVRGTLAWTLGVGGTD